MMKFIDTHAHLYDEAFDGDLDEVILKIKESGVVKCLFPGIDKSTYERQSRCAEKYKGFVYEAMGLHPTSVGENWKEELDFVFSCFKSKKYIAVGEIGLDGYWSKDFMTEQKIVFAQQLKLAKQLDLPVIIHLREATDALFEVFDSFKREDLPCGVFHAFSGSYQMYERLSKYGNFMFGIGGVVTYKKAGVAESIVNIPLDKLLLETDSPYLTPVPNRGKRNDSSNLVYIAEKIAQVKGLSVEEVAEATYENACRLFGL